MKLSSLLVTGGLFVVIVAAVVVGVREAEKYANEAGAGAIVTVGSAATGEKVTLGAFEVNIFTGRGAISGLTVPNSSIGSSKTSFVVDKAEIRIVPWSLLWGPLHIQSIEVAGPAIDLETSATSSNLAIILAAAAAYALASDGAGGDDKKLRVDHVAITGGKLSGRLYPFSTKLSLTLPDIAMQNLGGGEAGLSQADFAKALLAETVNKSVAAALHY
ncbi:MAG TPA: hypothetical protein DEB15_06995 [Pusillimonas sp.]|nr:hypothetical protein [Pusillimonas sp.]